MHAVHHICFKYWSVFLIFLQSKLFWENHFWVWWKGSAGLLCLHLHFILQLVSREPFQSFAAQRGGSASRHGLFPRRTRLNHSRETPDVQHTDDQSGIWSEHCRMCAVAKTLPRLVSCRVHRRLQCRLPSHGSFLGVHKKTEMLHLAVRLLPQEQSRGRSGAAGTRNATFRALWGLLYHPFCTIASIFFESDEGLDCYHHFLCTGWPHKL